MASPAFDAVTWVREFRTAGFALAPAVDGSTFFIALRCSPEDVRDEAARVRLEAVLAAAPGAWDAVRALLIAEPPGWWQTATPERPVAPTA